jgi:protein SCO1
MKTFPILLLLLWTSILSISRAEATNQPACCKKELAPAGRLSDTSLYQLTSSWTDDASNSVKLQTLAGRPQIVVMFFATCVSACPILVHDLKKIEASLPENICTNVGFTLVTFDSERDTPKVLANYRKRHSLPSNWTLLRGEPDDVLELAALLGVKFKKDPSGQFAHSNVITILNSQGEITTQIKGLNTDPTIAAAAVQSLFSKSH